ncbi:hypothetical protein V8C42DRAFT_127356 [Trichoderma barbatum]
MDNSSPPVDEVTSLLLPLDAVKRPKGILTAWHAVQRSDANSTAKIFLTYGGPTAWLAYHLARQITISSTNRKGKAACKRSIESLESRSIESKKLFAAELASAVSSGTQVNQRDVEKYRRWRQKLARFQKSIKDSLTVSATSPRVKRRAPTPRATVIVPPALPAGPLGEPPANPVSGRFIDHHFDAITINSIDYSPTSKSSPSSPIRPYQNDVITSILGPASQYQTLSNASLDQTRFLLPQSLFDSIEKVDDLNDKDALLASIILAIPILSNYVSCQMILEIKSTKVQHLAASLFNVEVEVADELRTICHPGGMRTVPHPHLRIYGCEYDAILPTFGTEISDAIKASSEYRDGVRNGNARTDCISMIISRRPRDSGFICLSLGVEAASLIKPRLSS